MSNPSIEGVGCSVVDYFYRRLRALLGALSVAILATQHVPASAQVRRNVNERAYDGIYDDGVSIATNVADGFTIVAVGDLIVSRPLRKDRDPGLDSIVKILQKSDVTFGNMETNVFDIRAFGGGSPNGEFPGGANISLPEVGPDLKLMGFNLVSRANNHAFDWGVEGMRETSQALDRSGIVHAGVGENLAEAGAARFLETAHGRICLVSLATTFTPWSRAADPAAGAPGRPGLNALRLTKRIKVSAEMFESVRRIRDALPDSTVGTKDQNEVAIAGVTFKNGDKVAYNYEPTTQNVTSILRNVRQGKQLSDFCVVSNHGHEPGNWSEWPPDYSQAFAHKLIDAGADAYVVHGPHRLRGIEIYKGRPIFYSVGNFIFDDLQTPLGADIYALYGKDPRVDTDADVVAQSTKESGQAFIDPVFYESVVTVSRFEQNQLAELRLYPIELGYLKRFADRGIPHLASATQAKTILERLQRLSKPFGTKITIENNVGVIRLRRTTSRAPG